MAQRIRLCSPPCVSFRQVPPHRTANTIHRKGRREASFVLLMAFVVLIIVLLSGPAANARDLSLSAQEGTGSSHVTESEKNVRMTAKKAFAEGEQLRAQGAVESLRRAIEKFEEALPLWQAVGDRRGEASTLNNIGLVYVSLGETQKGLEYYGRALPLRQAAGDRRGEASTLNNMGRVYALVGEHQKALDYYNRALPISRALGDRQREVSELQNIGVVYASVGEHEKALYYYNQALPLWRAIKNRRGEAHALTLIGAVYISMGENHRALDYFDHALPLRRAVGDRRGEAHTLNHIGIAYAWLGEHRKALDYFGQALPLRRAVGDRRGEAYTLNHMGASYAALGEREKALEHYSQALLLWRAIGDRNNEAMTLYGFARAEYERGHLVQSRTHIEAALDIVESLRTKVAGEELRASYLASKQSYYELYIALLMRLHQLDPSKGHDAAALQASERARARSLLEILTEAGADIRQGIDPVLLERERALQQQINAKERYRTELLSGGHTKEQAASAEKKLEDLLTQYQEVQQQIRANSPRYAALTQPQPLSLKEIQQQVLDRDTLLLEYALGEARSYLWAVTPTSITSFDLPKRTDIETAARRFYELLITRNQRVKGETDEQKRRRVARAAAEYPEAAAALSRMLLGPVADQISKKRLVIVSEGALQYVPFGALPVPSAQRPGDRNTNRPPTPDPRPLVVEHEIVNLPSASTLAVLRQEMARRKPATKTVAVLADPVFRREDERVKRIARRKVEETSQNGGIRILEREVERSARESDIADGGQPIPRLPFSRREAEAIVALVPPGEGIKAVDFAASRATMTSPELAQYRMVHLATHGILNSRHPELSGIVLSLVDERGGPQDGFLRLHEIYNLNLSADLVVLSACQTALGKEIKGEGLVGLTRGFMYAGAARVVASLWKVDDRATAELMKRFYKAMLGEDRLRPAAALRAAQMAMWKENRWKAPYYWAAFVLQGEWR